MSLSRVWLPVVASLLVAACGGGNDAAPAPGNSAPSAVNDAATVAEDTAVTIDVLANDTDADGQADLDPATVTVASAAQGSATVNTATGRVTFTPTANYSGPASFAYTVRDRAGAVSNQADVSITVTAVNDAPTISNIADRSTTLNTPTGPVPFTVGDVDHAATGLTLTGTSSNTTLVPNANIQFGGSGTSRTVNVAPATGRSGTATITVRVSDGAASATDTFVLTVNPGPPNQAPMARDDSAQTAEDTAIAINVLANDRDPDGSLDPASVTIISQSRGVAQPASGGVVNFTPDANYHGAAGFTYTVNDAEGATSNVATVVVTVNSVNDVPTASDQAVSGDEGTTITGTLVGADVDGDALTFAKASDPANGTLTLGGATYSYEPDLNFAGSDSFTFVANDGTADSAPATVSITVNDTSEAALTVPDAGAAENAGPLTFTVTLSRAPDAPVTIHYQTADGTAKVGSDYTAANGDLQFDANSALSQNVTVAVTNDAFHEADESMTLALTITAGADSVASGADLEATGTITNDDAENTTLLRVGAAKRSVKPSQAHIDGILENRIGGAEPTQRTQKFNLGGFGINPTQSLPNPADQAGEALTQPAESAAFSGSRGEEPIHLRVMLVEQPGGERLAFVTLDAIGAGNVIQDGVKAAVYRATGIAPQNILFGQTHSHAGPDLQGLWGGVPETWVDCDTSADKQELPGCGEDGWNAGLYQLAAEAAAEAFATRRAARLMLAQGHTVEFNNYRRPKIDPNADADGTLTLLRAVAEDGTPLGAILQYNAHPTSIDESPRAVHADYIQGAMDWLENSATGPGGVALYYNGPIADASGSGGRAGCQPAVQDGNYGNVRCRGEGIASQALQFTERELEPTLAIAEREVILPITNPGFLAFGAIGSFNRYYNFMQQVPVESIPGVGAEARNLPQLTPTATTLVSRVTIGGAEGGLEIVTIPGETTNSFGQYIRGLAKTNVMLLGLTHNSFGYIIPEEEFSYFDQEGDDGLVAPFTGYEENVSLGPLTAPLLRTQGYNMLFGYGPAQDIPPTLSACLSNAESAACVVQIIENRLDALVGGLSACVESGLGANGCPLRKTLEMTLGELASQCRDFDGPDAFCALFDAVRYTGIGEAIPELDMALLLDAAQAQTAGCDLLDPSNCLYPFPNDWFTAEAAEGTIQHEDRGGTGRRVNMNPLAMPRNAAGKPVDPTEWNRSDGFSPGALITTFVPNISLEQTFASPSREIGLANLALSQSPDAPILVLEVQDNGDEPARHLVWSEIDQNANILTITGAPNVGVRPVPGATNEHGHVQRPLNDGRAALLIRPAKNFAEGKRYVVVLRNLKDRYGNAIKPQPGFRACLNGGSTLPPVQQRCEQLEDKVFPVLRDAGIAVDGSVFLAWDFTVESTESAIGRLRHMRDDAFATLSSDPADEDCTQLTAANAATCAAPQLAITNVIENPQGGIKRRIEGMLTVPNYLAPIAPSPAENTALVGGTAQLCANAPEGEFASGCNDLRDGQDLAQGAAIPNRLFYSPADGTPAPDANNPFDPTGLRYGDGLPDQNGSMTTRFLCQIPAQASPDNPARASLYGHGQLDRGVAITYEGTPDVAREHNYMFCAVDWFGFRTGDAVNVLSSLADLSNFAVIPDASQQGMVNFMFLARAMAHPQGLGALPQFQDPASGRPLFDASEVFYNGNSQGGIFGGVVLAASKDVNRGVLGSLGMNYSTLLTRSKNFDQYAGVLYGAYPDPLDRQVLFSLMQMLWDRSENNGYAHHLVDNKAFGGPTNIAKLDTMYGDPQVTMFSAEVMARTMGLPYEDRQLAAAASRGAPVGPTGTRHPTVEPYYGLAALDYNNPAHVAGGALYTWDTANNEGAQTDFAHVPPTTNTPPRTGPDRHDASQKRRFGRCHMAHFLRTGGTLIDILPVQYDGAACPTVPPATPTVAPGEATTAPGFADAMAAALDRFAEALATIPDHLGAQEFIAALDAIIGGTQQLLADAATALTHEVAAAVGNDLPAPGQAADPQLPPPEQLLAGAAKRAIHVPVGTPLGGYLRPPVGGEYIGDDPVGEITDNQPSVNDACDPTEPDSCLPNVPLPDEARKAHSPYATYSPPTRGYYDSLIAKAVALYDGHDYIVMVKTDFIGMLDEVVQDVKADVKARTVSAAHPQGIDLGDGLIMSATHTHDGPGALANHSTRYFWLAMDLYQHEVYQRLIGQLGDVVIAALGDLKPARIGHGNGLESPNAGNGINGFRRGRLDTYDDNDQAGCAFVAAAQCPAGINDADELRKRIGVLRIDDAATGAPMAVVINFAEHGIAFDVENQYFSGDVLASIEREVEQGFAAPANAPAGYQAPIAMLVQNTGGDVTPKNVPYSIRGIEMLGKRMAPQVRAVVDGIASFQDAPDLRTVSQRVILNRERLGYAEDEYPYPWGAAQCGNDLAVPYVDAATGVVADKTGTEEIPTSTKGINERLGTELPEKHLYCIPATPPDAADLADNGVAENGAFVPGDTILSAAKIGDITLLVQPGEPLTEYGVRALEMAQAEGYAPADTFVWGYSADHIGYILPPVKEDWATFGGAESTTTFWGWKQGERFINGHRELLRALKDGKAAPADEFQIDYSRGKKMYANTPDAVPTPSLLPGAVVSQPANIKRFETTRFVFEGGDPVLDLPSVLMVHADGTPVRRANGEVLNTFFEMHLKYRLVSGRHLWTVEFEAPKDWAAGTYRFVVSGKARQGTTVEYALNSATFTVAPATNLQAQNLACAAGTCSVQLRYAAVPANYRVVDASIDPNNAAPMRTGRVTFTNGTDTVEVEADGSGNFSAAIGGTVTASSVDAWGNTAPAVTAAGAPPADEDGDGVPDASDQCRTQAGPASNNGCPEQGGGDEGFPVAVCVPAQIPGIGGECLEDVPVVGEALQDALDTAWNTVVGGGGGTEPPDTGAAEQLVADVVHEAATLPADLLASAQDTAGNAQNGTLVDRAAEAVVMEGKSFPNWSQPPAFGLANPYPSGVGGDGDVLTQGTPFHVRDAHNGTMLYPPPGVPFEGLPTAAPVQQIAAYRRQNDQWVEIPVQVDERFPYFLANANSGFSFYSGTDMELTYAWDRETWKAEGQCSIDPASVAPMADPVPGLDDDDEIAFMAADAGDAAAPTVAGPAGTQGPGQEVALSDPLNPGLPRFVYLFLQDGGSSFGEGHYVSYQRDANADQWVDRSFWADNDPEKIGTSNTGYGPNLSGTVCPDGTPASAQDSNDRFPRDGVTIASDKYKVYASGRWMVRSVQIAKPGQDGVYGADIMDRWKGRAFQQSPDSNVSVVGFEDEQVNWEANSALLGERVGAVRAIREIWGADSGTNVTKTETYYRDAYAYRYRVRVHPIPPDGLYTSWDYNRNAMVPAPGEDVPGGRYYTAVRATGVPIDGQNDDVGNIDGTDPVPGLGCPSPDDRGFIPPKPDGSCPAYFDVADPLLNLPLTMYNWEQVSAKGDLGSLVYLFELKSPTIGANALAIPYYRDDACLDDGTGDDPVARPYPGERYDDARVIAGYRAANGGIAYDQIPCTGKQGAHAQHGVHFLMPPESDNAMAPVPVNEIDGQQWAFAVPTAAPTNVGEQYANIVRAPLARIVRPRPAVTDVAGDQVPTDYYSCVAMAQQGGDERQEAAAKFSCAVIFGGGRAEGEGAGDEIQGPNTYVPMSDGNLIAANVYIPWACNVARNPAARQCPSILEMSGYESGSDEGTTPSGDVDNIVNPDPDSDKLPLTRGTRAAHDKFYKSGDRYVSVVASVRGTGCSAGEFDVFSRKSAYDGHQLVEWMAQQHWSNGKVGIFGHSYSGITGAMIASTNPPSLKMVSISGQIGDIYRDIVYPGGVSNYGFPLLWTGGVRPAYDYLGGTFAGLIADSQDRQCLRNQAERSRTVENEPLIQGLSDTDSPWFQERSVVNYLKHVTAPTQVVTAYQDEQTGPRGGTHVFDSLPQNLTRRLVILNGDHGSQTGPQEVRAEREFWIDRFMLGPNDPAPRGWSPGNALPAPVFADDGTATSRVLLEVTRDTGNRSNGHVDSTGFPLAQTQWTDLYFHGIYDDLTTAKETIRYGETESSSSYFSGSKRQAYSYQANSNTIDDNDATVSTADANGIDELTFALGIDSVAQSYTDTAGNAQTAFVIAGPVMADLWLSSTGTDTELMVQLIDYDPATGERLYLQRGVLRASHREILAERSQCAAFPAGGRITDRACTHLDNIYRPFRPHVNPQDIVPGQIARYRLEIFPVSHVFRAGHQLLVKIHAPSLDDNDWAYISKTAPALNTLHHSAEYPSSLRLPVIPLRDAQGNAIVQRLGGPTSTCSDDSMRCTYVEPLKDFAEECRQLGAQYDRSGGVFTDLICGVIEAVADALPIGGEGEISDSTYNVDNTASNRMGDAVQTVLGSAESNGLVKAGVGVVDMTPDVGYGAGQYSDKAVVDGTVDPYATARSQAKSYGVMSRLTARAIVVEGANGKRIALLKSDNYLAQDNLLRRVGQILAEQGSTIGYDQILHGVTHAHSTSYYSTLSAGVWVFQDAYESRFFENQARKLAAAILAAERDLKPARMGATTVRHKVFKGNITKPQRADDNTPAGYPKEYGDHGLVVVRFDDLTDAANPKPLAAWINWGQHPEGLDGYDLHSGDFVSFLERYVDRELGVPLVFSQGDVGSAEQSGNDQQRLRDDGSVCQGPGASGAACAASEGTWRDWNHKGFVQNERGVRFLADAVVKGFKAIGGDASLLGGDPRANNYIATVQVPYSSSFAIDYRNAWVPGPLSHPFPGVSACRTEPTVEGNPGVPNAADCTRPSDSQNGAQQIWESMKAHGLPVPEHYELPAFGTVEENLRLKLQAFRLGDIVLASCACEAQVDLILNFESRANDVPGDIYDGFDWACAIDGLKDDPQYAAACATQKQHYDPAEYPYDLVPHGGATNRDPAAIAHMRAQVHNPADGWDAPAYAPYANAEPADLKAIKGNFTKEELPADRGYKLAVGIGHAGDYNGYTVSYREYMAYDHYRKDLTAYGPHTADYMVTRLVRMAGAMRGGSELAPEPHDATAQVDEARQVALSTAHGRATHDSYEAFYAALSPDVGPASRVPGDQPRDIGYFEATTFDWRGGSTAVDNPFVKVQRCQDGATCGDNDPVDSASWQDFADQTGEVQTRVNWPTAQQLPSVYAGEWGWRWRANFEAFEGFPVRLGSTPAGTYRFVVHGCINDGSAPDANVANRIANFLAGMLPAALGGPLDDVLSPTGCKGGASPYALGSQAFNVHAGSIEYFWAAGARDGDLAIELFDDQSVPRTYTSAFPYLRDDGGSRFCKECTFRPWLTSTAGVASVTVEARGQTFTGTGAGKRWVVAGDFTEGETLVVRVAYADGRAARPEAFEYYYDNDDDSDGWPNFFDNCQAAANADQADNDGDGQGNACDTTPDGSGGGGDDETTQAPQLCTPEQTPEIPGECAADNGGEPVQDAIDEIYGAVTGGL